jgi:hypothetical protein
VAAGQRGNEDVGSAGADHAWMRAKRDAAERKKKVVTLDRVAPLDECSTEDHATTSL